MFKNKVVMNWDSLQSHKKGQPFSFKWHGIGGRITKGFARPIEDFKKVKFTKKEAKEIDTTAGIHYFGKVIAYYN